MNKEQIIQLLKDNYTRDIRKQLVKTILSDEKDGGKSDLQDRYKLINQIFSYVLKEANWQMPKNSKEWNYEPLEIMCEAFPKLDTTKWYKDQMLIAKQNIGVKVQQN